MELCQGGLHKAVEEPKRAVTHIQNTAPAPPAEMAATTPTRFPMPTRVAVAMIRSGSRKWSFSGKRSVFPRSLQHFGEETHRKKAGARRKKDPGGDQQKYQERQTQRAAAGQRIVTRSLHRRL